MTWLEEAADGLDTGAQDPSAVLPALAAAGLPRVGVPLDLGGSGGDVADAVTSVAAVSAHSLAAGFVLWSQRTYIEYLLQSPNGALRNRLLPDLLEGRVAGATGLSNAMKFLAGLEGLQITAKPPAHGESSGFILDGKMPWVTNLRVEGFHVAAAVAHADGSTFIASLSHDDEGVTRSADLDLMAMRSTSTAAIGISGAPIGPDRVIHPDAHEWLPEVRPAFLGLQCGMSIGLARRSLDEATASVGAGRSVLKEPIAALTRTLAEQERQLDRGLRAAAFQRNAAPLFQIRIALAEIAAEAVALELQASGGRAYLAVPGRAFARRWREAAFLPVITPSLVQLKTALAAQERNAA
ncbi:acyl-CoA dehydrogenase family protein [Microvirga massiliensis]|uniref:acyl-CoA dehydrogenase family protein n=1 Tax=Microvirga massiliensis TaxID=1033741 RepID=UPI001FCD40A6|nr:acyl-CoA dehydrogenase family protein [Microvirga massiliensis]